MFLQKFPIYRIFFSFFFFFFWGGGGGGGGGARGSDFCFTKNPNLNQYLLGGEGGKGGGGLE